MPANKLDPIDRKTPELQADGRMTNVELSPGRFSPCPGLRRAHARGTGLIRGYHADVNARELGLRGP